MTGPTMHALFDGSDAALIPDFSLPPWGLKVCDSDPTVYQVLDADGVVIAFPRRGTAGRSERRRLEKNAHVIAAAPDLLEALEVFIKQWDACGPNSDFGRYFQNVRSLAGVAISKATGVKS